MNREQFRNFVAERQKKQLEILDTKGPAYAGNQNTFANFERNAEDLGLTKFQIWSVYAFKHIDTIKRAIKDNPSAPVDKSEGLEGRIDDAINYLTLLAGMLKENK